VKSRGRGRERNRINRFTSARIYEIYSMTLSSYRQGGFINDLNFNQ